MAHTKIGPNAAAVIGVEMMDQARAEFVQQGQTVMLVMEGKAEAYKCRAKKKNGIVVHRMLGVHSDANWEHMKAWGGPEKYIDAAYMGPDVVMQFMNESGVLHAKDEPGQNPKNVQCAIDGLNYAHKRNQPIAINMDGTGGPDDSEIKHLVPLIRRMNEINAERGYDFAYLMHHEYYLMHDPRYQGDRQGRSVNYDPLSHNGDDPDNMLQYNNWVCGRFARVQYILRHTFNMDCPPQIIGEFGADDTISEYHGPWPPDFPGHQLSEETYASHLVWLAENVYDPKDPANPYYEYAKNVVGMCIFMYGNSGGWEGFDYSQKGVFRQLLEDYAMSNEAVIDYLVNDPVWSDYIVLAAVLNVRAAPDANAAKVNPALNAGDIVALDTANPVEADNYLWLHHERGWSAVQTLDGSWYGMESVVVEPDPEPEPEPEPAPVTRAEFGALAVRVAALEAEVERWKPVVTTVGYVKDACLALAQMLEEVDKAA